MKKTSSKLSRFWKILGPVLVTDASDDDSSGIATYSQAGAAYGLATLWTWIKNLKTQNHFISSLQFH